MPENSLIESAIRKIDAEILRNLDIIAEKAPRDTRLHQLILDAGVDEIDRLRKGHVRSLSETFYPEATKVVKTQTAIVDNLYKRIMVLVTIRKMLLEMRSGLVTGDVAQRVTEIANKIIAGLPITLTPYEEKKYLPTVQVPRKKHSVSSKKSE